MGTDTGFSNVKISDLVFLAEKIAKYLSYDNPKRIIKIISDYYEYRNIWGDIIRLENEINTGLSSVILGKLRLGGFSY